MCATRQEKKKSTRLNSHSDEQDEKRFNKIFGPNIVLLIGPLGNNEKTPETN